MVKLKNFKQKIDAEIDISYLDAACEALSTLVKSPAELKKLSQLKEERQSGAIPKKYAYRVLDIGIKLVSGKLGVCFPDPVREIVLTQNYAPITVQVVPSNNGIFNPATLEFLYERYSCSSNYDAMLHLFSEIIIRGNKETIAKTNISSPGSKFSVSAELLKLPEVAEGKIKKIVEPFGRTASISLRLREYYERMGFPLEVFYCDKDIYFQNYIRVLTHAPTALIAENRHLLSKFEIEKVRNLKRSEKKEGKTIPKGLFTDERKDAVKQLENLYKVNPDLLKGKSWKARIDSAAALFLLVNITFCGRCESFYTIKAPDDFERMFHQMVRASVLLHDINTESMSFGHYIYETFGKFEAEGVDPEEVLVVWDPPYIKKGEKECGDYETKFTIRDMRRLLDYIKETPYKVVFYHSYNPEIDKMCKAAGLEE